MYSYYGCCCDRDHAHDSPISFKHCGAGICWSWSKPMAASIIEISGNNTVLCTHVALLWLVSSNNDIL